MKLLLLSTSTVYGSGYLAYAEAYIRAHFEGCHRLVFVPYARPGGISWDAYTAKAADALGAWGFEVKGLHTFEGPEAALAWAEGVFVGGGNTFLLLKTLYETGALEPLRASATSRMPYLGSSAGSNLAGPSIRTTNDMPIVYPPSFEALGLVPVNLNPHYLDPDPSSQHMGETRETRLNEFHTENTTPVIGLREGSALFVEDGKYGLLGPHTARLFRAGRPPLELDHGSISPALFSESSAS